MDYMTNKSANINSHLNRFSLPHYYIALKCGQTEDLSEPKDPNCALPVRLFIRWLNQNLNLPLDVT